MMQERMIGPDSRMEDASRNHWLSPSSRRRMRGPVDPSKRSMVQFAVEGGKERLLELLLQHRANVFQRDLRGFSAFESAALHGRAKCLELLVQHVKQLRAERDGADLEMDESGSEREYKETLQASLNLAVTARSPASVAVLLRAGASPFKVTERQQDGSGAAALEMDESCRRILSIAKALAKHDEHLWEFVHNKVDLLLKWERLRSLCRKPRDSLVKETKLPVDVWHLIVDFL